MALQVIDLEIKFVDLALQFRDLHVPGRPEGGNGELALRSSNEVLKIEHAVWPEARPIS